MPRQVFALRTHPAGWPSSSHALPPATTCKLCSSLVETQPWVSWNASLQPRMCYSRHVRCAPRCRHAPPPQRAQRRHKGCASEELPPPHHISALDCGAHCIDGAQASPRVHPGGAHAPPVAARRPAAALLGPPEPAGAVRGSERCGGPGVRIAGDQMPPLPPLATPPLATLP